MANEKVTNQELMKLRRDLALRGLALAASYPQVHTGIVSHRKRIDGAIPWAPETDEKGWLDRSVSPEDIDMHNVVNDRLADRLLAAPLPATTVATPGDPRQRQKKVGDNFGVPVSTAKPWKKPWDK